MFYDSMIPSPLRALADCYFALECLRTINGAALPPVPGNGRLIRGPEGQHHRFIFSRGFLGQLNRLCHFGRHQQALEETSVCAIFRLKTHAIFCSWILSLNFLKHQIFSMALNSPVWLVPTASMWRCWVAQNKASTPRPSPSISMSFSNSMCCRKSAHSCAAASYLGGLAEVLLDVRCLATLLLLVAKRLSPHMASCGIFFFPYSPVSD